jgi:beta-aspartyl-peptidase (threonine type)
MKRTPDHYFFTPDRIKQLEQARLRGRIMLDHDEEGDEQKYGTIGAVARDREGNLAAATSTGGIVNKRMGRVGDSPIIGAGVYADNATCAVSATGYGEEFMRTVFAKTIADAIEFCGGTDAAAPPSTDGIDYLPVLTRKVKGRGGVICIDAAGRCASGMTTPKMIHGWIEHGGETICRFSTSSASPSWRSQYTWLASCPAQARIMAGSVTVPWKSCRRSSARRRASSRWARP